MPGKSATTKNLVKESEKAMKHLAKVDPKLGDLIKEVGPFTLEIAHLQSSFEALARSIVYQQLAGAAASSIFNRVRTLVSEHAFPTPDELLALPESTLRAAGLSRSKMLALIDLAEKTKAGSVPDPEQMESMTDAEIVAALTSIRGIGPWTVEMLLIFRLGRLDVMPSTDYGVRKGFSLTYGRPKSVAKKLVKKTIAIKASSPKEKNVKKPVDDLPTPKEVTEYAEIWRPYRSIASWYMWRAIDVHQARTKLEKKPPVKKIAAAKPVARKATSKKARSSSK